MVFYFLDDSVPGQLCLIDRGVGQKKGKVIVPDAGQKIARPDITHEKLPHFMQNQIAGLMTVMVVDMAEMFNLETNHRYRKMIPIATADFLVKPCSQVKDAVQ